MANLDLTKADKVYYGAGAKPETITLPPLPYLQLTGEGSPESEAFAASTEAIYTVAYSVRAICKAEGDDRLFTVAKLEGLWWVNGDREPLSTPREEWQWTLLIRLPEFVTEANVDAAKQAAMQKKRHARLQAVRFETLEEGLSVQMLHVGPFSKEPETLARMEAYMEREELAIGGKHHEVYLSDYRKVDPAALRTILRYPVSRKGAPQP